MPPACAMCVLIVSADPSPEAIARAIRDLGAPSYQERERAMQVLWSAGASAEPALRAALQSSDAEVVTRVRSLLDRIEFGLAPDAPSGLIELVATARTSGPGQFAVLAPRLLDWGQPGLAAAERLVERLTNVPSERVTLRAVIDRERWRLAPDEIAAGRDAAAVELLERGARAATLGGGAAAAQHCAAYFGARGEAAEALARWRPQAQSDNAAAIIAFHLARLANDHATACALAESIGLDVWREAALFDAGDWRRLAGLAQPLPDRRAIIFGLRAAYLQLAGQPDLAIAAVEELKKLPQSDDTGGAPPITFRALMFLGRTDEAWQRIAASTAADAPLIRFEILCQKRRYADALAALDAAEPQLSSLRRRHDLARWRLHHLLGDTAARQSALQRLARKPEGASDLVVLQDAVEAVAAARRLTDARTLASVALEHGGDPATVLGKSFPRTPLAAEVWYRILRLQYPAESCRETVDRLPALLDRRLAEPAGRDALSRAMNLIDAQPLAQAARWRQGLGEACQAAGLSDEARSLMAESAAKLGTAAGWIRLGDLLSEQRRFAEAAAAYESAWRSAPRQPLPLWLTGWARQRAGDAAGRDWCERAHQVTLGDEAARAAFVEELGKRASLGPEFAEAQRRERRLILALANLGSDHARTAQGLLSSDPLARSDRLQAAEDCQRYLVRLLQTNSYFRRHDGYLNVLHRLEANRARGLLARGDIEGAVAAASAAHALLPGQPSPAEHLVPALMRLGRTAEAEAVYRAPADVLDRLCVEFPRSAAFRQSRAWLAARAGRDLSLAVEHARRAAELAPELPSVHETMAEALFQAGDRAGAVAAIQKAIDLDPTSRTWQLQKQRIDAGDPSAPLPEGR